MPETDTTAPLAAPPPRLFVDTGLLELSPSFTAVASALAKAQSAFQPVEKNRTATVTPKDGGRGFSFDYADLAACLSAVMPALTAAGLALLQPVTNEQGIVRVQTWLLHGASGEWIRTKTLALEGGRDQKALGIATTYLRRYQVSALLGLAPEDDVDDGFESEPANERRQAPPAAAPAGRPPVVDPGLPGVDPIAACREAIAEKAWDRFLKAIGTVKAGAVREQLQKEYAAARHTTKPTTEAAK
jgi:hypothetical protein